MKFLFFGAHPDDVEMGCAGTILRLKKAGHWIGIVDLTKGELGTRGTKETRAQESLEATKFMGIDYRTNLDLGDAHISDATENKVKIVEEIRKSKPDYVFINAPRDRHIDHGYASSLVKDCCFLSGLIKYYNPQKLEPHRPVNVFSYIQDQYIDPDFVVDVSNCFEEKMSVLHLYKTQFFQGDTKGPKTPISTSEFLEFFKGRASQMGRLIGARFGEGYIAHQPLNMDDMAWF